MSPNRKLRATLKRLEKSLDDVEAVLRRDRVREEVGLNESVAERIANLEVVASDIESALTAVRDILS
jgi:hypothetical protein